MGLFLDYLTKLDEDASEPVRILMTDPAGRRFHRSFPERTIAINWATRNGFTIDDIQPMYQHRQQPQNNPPQKNKQTQRTISSPYELEKGDVIKHGLLGLCIFRRYEGTSAIVQDRSGKLSRVLVSSLQPVLQIEEASYKGNVGAMEMARFFMLASDEQKVRLKQLVALAQKDETKSPAVWKLVHSVVGGKKLVGSGFS